MIKGSHYPLLFCCAPWYSLWGCLWEGITCTRQLRTWHRYYRLSFYSGPGGILAFANGAEEELEGHGIGYFDLAMPVGFGIKPVGFDIKLVCFSSSVFVLLGSAEFIKDSKWGVEGLCWESWIPPPLHPSFIWDNFSQIQVQSCCKNWKGILEYSEVRFSLERWSGCFTVILSAPWLLI